MKKFGLLASLLAFAFGLVSCGNSNPAPTPEPEVKYTAAKVAEDFNANLESVGLESYALEYNDTYKDFEGFFLIDESEDESEDNLSYAASIVASFLPEYMVVETAIYGDPTSEDYYDLFEDQSYYFYVDFVSPDELSYAAIISYCYMGYLCAQISIADLVEAE